VERINRAQLLKASIAAAVTATVLSLGIVHAQADKPVASPWAMTVDVTLDPSAAAPTTGPFYTSGTVQRPGAAAGAAPIGFYHSWGWRFDPTRPMGGSVATGSFEILGQGEIVLSGVQDERRTISGGTGNFRAVGGQAEMVATGPNSFRVTFDITSHRNVGSN
jgi:hypothetical protein